MPFIYQYLGVFSPTDFLSSFLLILSNLWSFRTGFLSLRKAELCGFQFDLRLRVLRRLEIPSKRLFVVFEACFKVSF